MLRSEGKEREAEGRKEGRREREGEEAAGQNTNTIDTALLAHPFRVVPERTSAVAPKPSPNSAGIPNTGS